MKKLLMLAIVAATMAACGSKPKMALHGENPGAPDGTMIYLIQSSEAVDSAEVRNEKFRFALEGVEPGEYLIRRINAEGKPEVMLLYLDNYDTYAVLTPETYTAFQSTFIRAEVTGNPTHQAMAEINDIIINDRPYDPEMGAKMEVKLREVAAEGGMAAALAMWKYSSYFSRFMTYDELNAVLAGFPEYVKESTVGMQVAENMSHIMSSLPGAPAPDFTLNTPEGKPLKLSEFVKGKKVVLIDFWASWCAPCRAENPKVKGVYEQYHDKGFDVLGVSLDSNADKWGVAIAEDGLPWSHVSELKGWDSAVCKQYNFNGIPYLVLVDGEGRILATGSNLRNNLAETVEKYCI